VRTDDKANSCLCQIRVDDTLRVRCKLGLEDKIVATILRCSCFDKMKSPFEGLDDN
jgi:hypothetical protein